MNFTLGQQSIYRLLSPLALSVLLCWASTAKAQWEPLRGPLGRGVLSVDVSTDGLAVVLARDSLYSQEPASEVWHPVAGPAMLSSGRLAVLSRSDWAIVSGDNLYLTSDGGQNWGTWSRGSGSTGSLVALEPNRSLLVVDSSTPSGLVRYTWPTFSVSLVPTPSKAQEVATLGEQIAISTSDSVFVSLDRGGSWIGHPRTPEGGLALGIDACTYLGMKRWCGSEWEEYGLESLRHDRPYWYETVTDIEVLGDGIIVAALTSTIGETGLYGAFYTRDDGRTWHRPDGGQDLVSDLAVSATGGILAASPAGLYELDLATGSSHPLPVGAYPIERFAIDRQGRLLVGSENERIIFTKQIGEIKWTAWRQGLAPSGRSRSGLRWVLTVPDGGFAGSYGEGRGQCYYGYAPPTGWSALASSYECGSGDAAMLSTGEVANIVEGGILAIDIETRAFRTIMPPGSRAMSGLAGHGSDVLAVSVHNGGREIHLTRDGGLSWIVVPAPTRNFGATHAFSDSGTLFVDGIQELVADARFEHKRTGTLLGNVGGRLFAASNDTLLVSDSGQEWTAVDEPLGSAITQVGLWPDGRAVVLSDGGLLRSTAIAANLSPGPTAQESSWELDLYPVPARNGVKIRAGGGSPVRIEVANMLGRRVVFQQEPATRPGDVIKLDVSGLSAGLYAVVVTEGVIVRRAIFPVTR